MCRISFYQTLCLYVLRPRFCTSLSVYSRLLPDYSASLSKYGYHGTDPRWVVRSALCCEKGSYLDGAGPEGKYRCGAWPVVAWSRDLAHTELVP